MPALVYMWRSEVSVQEPVLSFYHVGSEDQTRVVCRGSKCLSQLSYLVGPPFSIFEGRKSAGLETRRPAPEQAFFSQTL